MSSVLSPSHSGIKAIDGIYVPSDYGVGEKSSLAHSKLNRSPWIQVDLGLNRYIDGVKIWDRTGGNPCELVMVFNC